ncbi:hypothetical protein [Acinetobacter beijerinckii]|uniref:hypothetical protein n=1 Tax=Acinetobacter beijerinckii TaxID=262668 RepID=UPI004054B3CE
MIDVQIVRYVDSSFPGWIECILRDASNREWLFIGKVAIFSDQHLHEISRYPQQGMIACEIIREWIGADGLERCLITTERPWGISAKEGGD